MLLLVKQRSELHSKCKCSRMHSMEQSLKHPEGFIGVNVCLWWRENTSNVVYCHFYLDLFFTAPPTSLLHTTFWQCSKRRSLLSPKAAPTAYCLLLGQNSSVVHVKVVISPFMQHYCSDLALPPCMLLYVNCPWNLSIFDMAPFAN